MSNATFSRKPLVAAVLTTLAVFSAGAMAGETEEAKTNVKLTIGTAESTTDKTVAGTVQKKLGPRSSTTNSRTPPARSRSTKAPTRATRRSRSARAQTTRLPASSPTNFPA